jgi:hypothetical protein
VKRNSLLYCKVLLAGVLATFTQDVANVAFRAIGVYQGLPAEVVTKWFAYAMQGTFFHQHIDISPDIDGSLIQTMVLHYLIGICMALPFLLIVRRLPGVGLTTAALVYGAITVAFPWFFMFPAMGYGFFGLATPQDMGAIQGAFLTHLVFGAGLAWSFRVLRIGGAST